MEQIMRYLVLSPIPFTLEKRKKIIEILTDHFRVIVLWCEMGGGGIV